MKSWQRWQEWWRSSTSSQARWLRAAHDALFGEMPILAAGTALYAIIAAVPLLAAVVSVYGLAADPHEIHGHLNSLSQVIPKDIVDFLGDQLERQAQRSSGELGIQLATSVALALYSARGSANAMMETLNRAYRVTEVRGTLRLVALSFGIAAATLVGLMILFATVVALPAIIALLDLKGFHLVRIIRWPTLLGLVFASLLGLYRYAPSPRPAGMRLQVWPGAAVATVLLVVVSWGLSEWVERIASYELFYGTFGSVIVIVLWFYLGTLTVVIGGYVNAELERGAAIPAAKPDM